MRKLGVIGAGVMGRGIAQLFAQAGCEVKCLDAQEGAARKAIEHARSMIARGVDKGRITKLEAEAAGARMRACADIAELGDCDVIVEAIVEDLAAKRDLFAQLETVASPQAILASNTSSLMIAEIAASCRYPERVAGLHFFNPVPLMKVVEVIPAVRTARSTVEVLQELVQSTGHRVVVAADQPGFLVNHAGRGLYTEGLRALEENVASHADIDVLVREAAGFRMGPFELMDLTGLDVSGKVMESIYEQFQHEPRFRPSSLVRPRMAAGLYGRKTGVGWYAYDADKRVDAPERPVPPLVAGLKLWIDPSADCAAKLAKLAQTAGAESTDSIDGDSLLIVQPWG